MYSSVHGVTGALIMAASPDPILGAGLAFISHFVWDYVGESGIGSVKKSAAIEGALLLAFIIGAFFTEAPWLYLLGWAMGNLPDLIDKPLAMLLGRKQWFSCHNGKGLFQWKGKKLGYPVKIPITVEQTLLFNLFSTIIWLLAVSIL
jgi:hypothetical protein